MPSIIMYDLFHIGPALYTSIWIHSKYAFSVIWSRASVCGCVWAVFTTGPDPASVGQRDAANHPATNVPLRGGRRPLKAAVVVAAGDS